MYELDFLMVAERVIKNKRTGEEYVEIYPKFLVKRTKDLMIRGGDFYAIWDEQNSLWSTDEYRALELIDNALMEYKTKNKDRFNGRIKVLFLWDASTGSIDSWHKYCSKQCRDNYTQLDDNLIFSNQDTVRQDYASRRLNYPLEKAETPSWDRIISVLYDKDEREKIEWCIGSIINGDSKTIHKFAVLYGPAGAGKSTILNIVQELFDGYYSVFDAKALGSANNAFALEAFKNNPLVAIQHDGDLSRIEDNTRINSLVSHEQMTVNEKHKSLYTAKFKSFLFMGTNKPVRITDAKSGLIRRLIDITPSGNKLEPNEYIQLMGRVKFELGGIAWKCLQIYENDKRKYDSYIPTSMLGASNDFYNFVLDSYYDFKKEDGITLKEAWTMYKVYCEDTKVPYPMTQRAFKEELKNYFRNYQERVGNMRNYYSDFWHEKFTSKSGKEKSTKEYRIELKECESAFDKAYPDILAQYATEQETPAKAWEKTKTTLKSLDTKKLHYAKPPENHIVIDFDLKDSDGKKSLQRNIDEASKWPETYAEISKGGNGIHLHYIYKGDVEKLDGLYSKDVEIKKFTGGSSLRRKLTKCSASAIAVLSVVLPERKEKNLLFDKEQFLTENSIRRGIIKNLKKEVHADTRSSVDFIYSILENAYRSGLEYDVSDLKKRVIVFAMKSTHQSEYCLKLVDKMKFKSKSIEEMQDIENEKPVQQNESLPIIFFDIEVFPNLFLINWKYQGKDKKITRMINPNSAMVAKLVSLGRLIGYNNRKYDNHIVYAAMRNSDPHYLYSVSKAIIGGDKDQLFAGAYGLSYTDVYDFAKKKQSLKKWEIELGISHKELGLPWDEPVPEERWVEVAEYCDNDVFATEAVFDHLQSDFAARLILSDLAGLTPNHKTNSLTEKIVIFDGNSEPQNEYRWRNLAEPVKELPDDVMAFLKEFFPKMMDAWADRGSLLPYFPGYIYSYGKSMYRGELVGEGGYVYAEPGIHCDVALLDVVSMHPFSLMAECLLGPKYTRRFLDIVYSRVAIKHQDIEFLSTVMDGKLKPYADKMVAGEVIPKDLADALKIAINSLYGLTSAKFKNAFKDDRNVDNIVAKRGALFMLDLKYEVQRRGFTVAHIKTDSIKIPDATPEIIQFVMDFGEQYGYTFEHEATYERMCLVNDAVYIAKYSDGTWSATGTQFAVPYVFKKLFSKEPIEFRDLCETKSVTSAIYLDLNENLPDVTLYENIAKWRSVPEEEQSEELTKKAIRILDEYSYLSDEELTLKIEEGHNRRFIGRVGSFCPVKDNMGGGILLRKQDNKYYAVGGTKGYRWLESEIVKVNGGAELVDISYYDAMVWDAVKAIEKYGSAEEFIECENITEELSKDTPPWVMPCGDNKRTTCFECPAYKSNGEVNVCELGYEISGIIKKKGDLL